MSVYYTLCFLAALAIFIAFANQYVVKIQTTIAITAGSMLISALLVLFGKLGWFNLEPLAVKTMESIDFQNFLLKGILGFLLFAGGLGINLKALRSQKWEITILSIVATLLSTLLIGYGFWFIAKLLGWELPLVYCMLFGALISPTDPIAVLAIAGCQLYHAARLAEDVATGRPGWWGGLAPSGVPYTDSLDLPAIQRAASQPAGGCRP
jgi:CPA1 family monovalent cation:H+ antiporter